MFLNLYSNFKIYVIIDLNKMIEGVEMNLKRIIYFVFIAVFCFFLFNVRLNALCYDSELNEWATDLELEFIDFNPSLINEQTGKKLAYTMNYAFIFGLSKHRDDVILKSLDDRDNQKVWMYIPGHKIWGIPNYSYGYTVYYKLSVVGGENSSCPGEILKTFEKKMEPFNLYHKTEMCDDYPDAPLCAIYKDTSNISEQEFNYQMEQYIREVIPPKIPFIIKLGNFFLDYFIYILIPFLLISTVYIVKIQGVKRKEANK